ncbi:DsrE family protein [uncultured Formosa sp.]|uniref:DsrE family protein n=1 Tax=uncultured Formosa sp. TaxID=255435 RepID=UPI00260C9EC9|nr:DsrE family protein [uncultured Formosa sp.]
MKNTFQNFFALTLFLSVINFSFGQVNKPTTGPVFDTVGAIYSIDDLDFTPNPSQELKAIFDIANKQADAGKVNSIISSMHRYYNMHVRYGIPKEQIHLALVLHGGAVKDALNSTVYKEKFNVDNPNVSLIKSLSEMGVDVFLCGQSMTAKGYNKSDLLPEVKVGLSAMSVLTVYQMDNYALIKF